LPHQFVVANLSTVKEIINAIKDMHVRGAGLIGATAGFGMYLATIEAARKSEAYDSYLRECADLLKASRPTAVNLEWAVNRQLQAISKGTSSDEKIKIALDNANRIADEDADYCRRIGGYGVQLIESISKKKNGAVVNILTHCNAGWLAFVDYGSATAPVYEAFDRGIAVHVWVDETRPRNQGASLTAWELVNQGIPHTVIADNTGGHLMQHGLVDLAIVGTDRVTANGDVCNKIGTYLKALAAKDNGVPFYVGLPSPTIDFTVGDGLTEIPIEQRNADEVATIVGRTAEGRIETVRIVPEGSEVANYAFDVTPARLVTGLITERGVIAPTRAALARAFTERAAAAE